MGLTTIAWTVNPVAVLLKVHVNVLHPVLESRVNLTRIAQLTSIVVASSIEHVR